MRLDIIILGNSVDSVKKCLIAVWYEKIVWL